MTFVITYHAPSPQRPYDYWCRVVRSTAYGSDLHKLIEEFQPVLWVHGHVHHSRDYHIGKTRIICNPHGYIGEEPMRWRHDETRCVALSKPCIVP